MVFRSFMLALSGALALAAPAANAAGPDWSKATTISMVMSEYQFTPSQLSFERGKPYRLHLANAGRELHEIDAPEFFKTITPADPAMLVREGQEIDVEPGQQADFLFVPNQSGQFPFECEDHVEFGMTGSIAVK
jgi:uncharacterized cupredoxin-like copper-binding protein